MLAAPGNATPVQLPGIAKFYVWLVVFDRIAPVVIGAV